MLPRLSTRPKKINLTMPRLEYRFANTNNKKQLKRQSFTKETIMRRDASTESWKSNFNRSLISSFAKKRHLASFTKLTSIRSRD